LPLWRRSCFSLATISLAARETRHCSSSAGVALRQVLSTARTVVATLPLGRQSVARPYRGVVEKNFDQSMSRDEQRVARMRASGSTDRKLRLTEPRDSLVLGQQSLESGISGFQKTTTSILLPSLALGIHRAPARADQAGAIRRSANWPIHHLKYDADRNRDAVLNHGTRVLFCVGKMKLTRILKSKDHRHRSEMAKMRTEPLSFRSASPNTFPGNGSLNAYSEQ